MQVSLTALNTFCFQIRPCIHIRPLNESKENTFMHLEKAMLQPKIQLKSRVCTFKKVGPSKTANQKLKLKEHILYISYVSENKKLIFKHFVVVVKNIKLTKKMFNTQKYKKRNLNFYVFLLCVAKKLLMFQVK